MTTRLRLTTAQAAEHANCHPHTILRALEAEELHGNQRVTRGRWKIRVECLEAWLDGDRCPHGMGRAAGETVA